MGRFVPAKWTLGNAGSVTLMPQHFDLCVIGTGSGNSVVDERFSDWSVAVVERGTFGGTCLNRGCVPSKMLIYPADIVESIRHAAALGVDAHVDSVRWADIRDRTFGRIDPIVEGGRQYRSHLSNHTVFEVDAHFVGDHLLQLGHGADADRITADRFVLAAGARTMVPPDIAGLADIDYHTSDTIMRVDDIPRRLGIIGGGFIATEMAHVFDAFGSAVTMVTRREGLLLREDAEISARITDRFAERLDLKRSARPVRVHRSDGGIVVELDSDAGPPSFECDALLIATGRIPNGDQLRVEETGVSLDHDGYVMTDNTLSTGVEGIWALGDIRNSMQLKHLANLEARVVQHNLLHPDDRRHVDERFVPHAVFTSPQIGAVGLTEAEAVARGIDVAVAVRSYGGTAYGWAMEDTTSCAKVIVDRETRHVVGVHVIGPQASILIQQVVQGMRFGQTVDQMARDVIYPHPALSEVIENVLLDVIDQMERTHDTHVARHG